MRVAGLILNLKKMLLSPTHAKIVYGVRPLHKALLLPAATRRQALQKKLSLQLSLRHSSLI